MLNTQIVTEFGISAIESLEGFIIASGTTLVRATFEHTYFAGPEDVRRRTPYYPNHARRSNEHYPGLKKADHAIWSGDGRRVRLDDNSRAQIAWQGYTGMPIQRRSGYGLRHIWGHPWDPDAFTAGWNFCYMPSWAGLLTEEQHANSELQQAIRQASWDLYFRDDPVCERPEFVQDPGIDLDELLGGQPLRIVRRKFFRGEASSKAANSSTVDAGASVIDKVRDIRTKANGSWVMIYKGARLLQGKPHKPFTSRNTENRAKYIVRKIHREVNLSFSDIERLLIEHGLVRGTESSSVACWNSDSTSGNSSG